MKAPFPYFGGKSRIAAEVWRHLGNPPNYVEPFFGSGAVLLSRPGWYPGISWLETVNDIDGYICNFWRAVRSDPEEVAYYARWPINTNDLTARHIWLLNREDELVLRLEGDPDYYDPKIAGWWVWGICCWIGCGWCAGDGPWNTDGQKRINIRKIQATDSDPASPKPSGNMARRGVKRVKIKCGYGQGITRNDVIAADIDNNGTFCLPRPKQERDVWLKRVALGKTRGLLSHVVDSAGRRHNHRVEIPDDPEKRIRYFLEAGTGKYGLVPWLVSLAERLSNVRVCCGDWTSVTSTTVTTHVGITGMFLDPPYLAETGRRKNIYPKDDHNVAADVRNWCIEKGYDPEMRIVLCGYTGEHDVLAEYGWQSVRWTAGIGMSSTRKNKRRKNIRSAENREHVLWFSPFCLDPEAGEMEYAANSSASHYDGETSETSKEEFAASDSQSSQLKLFDF